MTEQQAKRRGRPPKAAADRKDGNLTFRTRGTLRERLSAAAAASGRSISEEVERRLETSFDAADAASAAGEAVNARFDRIAKEAIYSAFEEYEIRIGNRDGFNFGYWMGQALAEAIKKHKAKFPRDSIWYEDPKLLGLIKEAAQKRLDFLFEDYRRVEYVGNRTEAFEAVWPIVLGNSASGVYERRAVEARARREAEEAEQASVGEA